VEKYKYKFVAIIIIALISRVLVCFYSGLPWFVSDTYSYLEMGEAIINGVPISYFPNGYPLLIAFLKLIFFNDQLLVALIITNIFLQLLTIILIELTLRNLDVKDNLRLICLLIIAIYPNQLNYTRQLLTEVSSLFFLTLTLYFFSRNMNYMGGFTGYLSSQFRPTLLPLVPIQLVFEIFKKNYKKSVKLFLGFIIGLSVFIMLESFNIVKPAQNFGTNLLISIQSDSRNIIWEPKIFSEEEKLNPIKTYFTFIIENPKEYLKQRIISLWALWGPIPLTHRGAFEKFLIALRFPLLIFSIFAIFYRKRIGLSLDFIFIMSSPIILITLIHTLFFSQQRFTYVVEPFAIILSVIFIDYVIKVLKAKKAIKNES
jgi:hypothetical protein